MTSGSRTAAPIEGLITQLVQQAPLLAPPVVGALLAELAADGRPLARAIALVVEHLVAGTADMAIALPPLAMACATLVDVRLTDREREAARYEIETLLPVPGAPAPSLIAPDVPLLSLSRGPRPRT